jgi:hypothetical protein
MTDGTPAAAQSASTWFASAIASFTSLSSTHVCRSLANWVLAAWETIREFVRWYLDEIDDLPRGPEHQRDRE